MPRITRSQADAIEKPPYYPSPLAELDFSKAENTIEDAAVVSELKGLKAAYRGALGISKRGKKARNRKKDQQIVEVVEYHDTSDNTLPSEIPNAVAHDHQGNWILQFFQSYQRLTKDTENVPTPQQDSIQTRLGRITRRKAAQEEVIQSNVPVPDVLVPEPGTSALAQRLHDLDYVSLFPGPSTRPSTIRQPSANEEVANKNYRAEQVTQLTEELRALRQAPSQEQLGTRRASQPLVIQEELPETPQAPKSPVKTLAEVEEAYGSVDSPAPAETEEDSFVEQIITRSPAKPVSRIEDSLEALDQLEEALEAIGEVALAKRIVSTVSENSRVASHTSAGRVLPLERSKSLRARKPEPVVSGLQKSNTVRGNTTKRTVAIQREDPVKPGYSSMRTNPTVPQSTPALKKAVSMTFGATKSRVQPKETPKPQPYVRAAVKRPLSLLPPKETVKSAKPLTRPTFELSGEAVARKLREQREARVAQRSTSEGSPPPVRIPSDGRHKSTKPTTKATFVLPSAALSLKKKEALAARLQLQKEEEQLRREFKAKPIRKSVVPTSRETVASQARQSRVGLDNIVEALALPKRTLSSGANIGARRPPVQPAPQANVSVTRMRLAAPTAKQAPPVRVSFMTGRNMPGTVNAKGKEIYERATKWTEGIGRERREREAAAKRAREEAAERGRQASREWAMKAMARKTTQNDTMGPGFGPGGQLGLRV